MMTQRPNKTNIPELCCKSDDDPKTNKTNILVYAVKSDDDTKTETLKPDKIIKRFSGEDFPQPIQS